MRSSSTHGESRLFTRVQSWVWPKSVFCATSMRPCRAASLFSVLMASSRLPRMMSTFAAMPGTLACIFSLLGSKKWIIRDGLNGMSASRARSCATSWCACWRPRSTCARPAAACGSCVASRARATTSRCCSATSPRPASALRLPGVAGRHEDFASGQYVESSPGAERAGVTAAAGTIVTAFPPRRGGCRRFDSVLSNIRISGGIRP